MDLQSVVLCVNRLYNNYNPETSQKLRDDKIKFLMSELGNNQSFQLEKAVDGIIHDENIRKFPTLAQIKNYMPAVALKETEYCNTCEHTGYYNVWQLKQDINKYYSIAYACSCNTSANGMTVIDSRAIPIRAHNPYPPNDKRHEIINKQKAEWNYQRLDTDTFKALVYSHKMKSVNA